MPQWPSVRGQLPSVSHIIFVRFHISVITLELVIEYLRWRYNSDGKRDSKSGVILLSKICDKIYVIPYTTRVGVPILNMIMFKLYHEVKSDPNFKISIVQKWKDMTITDQFMEYQIDLDTEDREMALTRKCALDRNDESHVELGALYLEQGNVVRALTLIRKFLNFSNNSRNVKGLSNRNP